MAWAQNKLVRGSFVVAGFFETRKDVSKICSDLFEGPECQRNQRLGKQNEKSAFLAVEVSSKNDSEHVTNNFHGQSSTEKQKNEHWTKCL